MKNNIVLKTVMMGMLVAGCGNQVAPGGKVIAHAGTPAGAPNVELHTRAGTPYVRVQDADFSLKTTWNKPAKDDFQMVEVLTPDGHLYLRKELPVGADGVVDLQVLVAGTYIQDFSMTGTWTARFFRNVADAPAQEFSFQILDGELAVAKP